jgi:drug/metabolite transporter (DMT)-like permease
VSSSGPISGESIFLALLTVALNSAAQLMLRGAALGGASATSPLTLLKSPLFMGALAVYGLSVLTWLSVLKRVPLPVAIPFVALMYIAVPIGAKLVFGDPLTWRMAAGSVLIVAGVLVVAAK